MALDPDARPSHHENHPVGHLDQTPDIISALTTIVVSAVDSFPDVDVAGVSVLNTDGTLETWAATDPVVAHLDVVQREVREGPMYADWGARGRLVLPDLTDVHDRAGGAAGLWPAYRRRAADAGIRSQTVLRLNVPARRRALLTLSAEQPRVLPSRLELVDLFVSQAALVVGCADSVQQLNEAVRSRKVIGQALGLVMGQYRMSEAQAFGYLRRVSQERNVKLREVCAEMVEEHESGISGIGD